MYLCEDVKPLWNKTVLVPVCPDENPKYFVYEARKD